MAAVKTRTAEELKQSKYNYFIVLDLSVNEKNPTTILQALKKKFPANQGTPKDPYLARLLELKGDMEQVLVNDARYDDASGQYVAKSGIRKEEGERAKNFKLSEVMTIVRVKCQSNGIMYKTELRKLCVDANKKAVFFEFAELEKKFKDEKLDSVVKYIDNETNIINFIAFDDISDLLQVEGFADLYAYLGLTNSASSQQILSEEKRITNEKLANTGDKEKKNRINAFSGNIQTIFKTPASRKQYDDYLKSRESVWSQFKIRKAYSKEISLNEYIDFVEKLMKALNIRLDDAQTMLGAGLKNYGFIVTGGTANGAEKSKMGITDLSSCRFCGSLYKKGAKSCPNCGKLLVSACWNCGASMDLTVTSVCGKCGASEALQKSFAAEVINLNKLFQSGQYKEYALKSEAFKRTYSSFNQPRSQVEREMAAITKTSDDIVSKQREKETTSKNYLAKINAAITSRKYFEAQNLLRQLKQVVPDANVKAEESRINAVIAEVQQIYRQICALGSDEARIIPEYMRLYEKCVDYSEAQSVIKKFPPKPPVEVTVSVSERGNIIKWNVRPDDTITYSVVRKIGAAPRSASDGDLLVSGLRAFTFTDLKAENVVPYFYGVFATRLGSDSALTCTKASCQRYANVTIKSSKVLVNGLKVEFASLSGVSKVIVVRSNDATPPKSISSGTKIPVDENGFTDSTLPGSGLYGYFIVCEYIVNGKPVYSSGISETFEFYERPSFVENVRFKKEEGNLFCVTFNEPAVGKFDIYASKTAVVGLKSNEYYNISKLNGLTDIECKNVKPTSVNFELPGRGDWFFYPVCVQKSEFTVGDEYIYRDTSPKSAVVQYEVKVNKNSTVSIDFACDHLVELDAVRVVGTVGRRPRNVNDGECVSVLDGIKFKKPLFSKEYKASIKVSVEGRNRGNVYAVFAENDQGIIFKRKG